MSENLFIEKNLSKKETYEALLPQIEALLLGENDLIACSANVCAALRETFGFLWVGFYFVKDLTPALSEGEGGGKQSGIKRQLVLGPFQGPVACTRIDFGKGVCGAAWKEQQTIIVKDVDAFPGHIACSSLSKSEIVVPLFKNKNVVAVLDVDSGVLACFDDVDKMYLEKLVKLLERLF